MTVTLSNQNEPQFELVDEPEPAPRAPEDDENEDDDAGSTEKE
jgi:hypothetical protein